LRDTGNALVILTRRGRWAAVLFGVPQTYVPVEDVALAFRRGLVVARTILSQRRSLLHRSKGRVQAGHVGQVGDVLQVKLSIVRAE